ncbi:hypothetical protein AN641_03045 [Candidatus Epulonipiscioides gigas]|nr:hypothetical protein AN641_03045 [Epulopiscium sp. SCG-C07WGA-EpuloA2]
MNFKKIFFIFRLLSTIFIITPILAKDIIYTLDSDISQDWTLQIDINKVLTENLSLKGKIEDPKILIIYSHPNKKYLNSKIGTTGTIIDIGYELEYLLEKDYGVGVYHHIITNQPARYDAYELIAQEVKKILSYNPSIEVIIDLSIADGLKSSSYMMHGQEIVDVSLVNGLSLNEHTGELGIHSLFPNHYVQTNLAFSTQMYGLEDSIISDIYITDFRHSLHLTPKSLLVNFGNVQDDFDIVVDTVPLFVENLAAILELEKQEIK